MDEDLYKSIKLFCEATREEVVLPVASPACLHNPRRPADPSRYKIPACFDPNFKTYPELVKDFFRKVLDRLKR